MLNDHCLAGFFARIVASLVLKKVLLLIVVASVPLVGGHGHLLALPLIVVDLMPRAGLGLGIKKVSGNVCGQDESTFGSDSLKPD